MTDVVEELAKLLAKRRGEIWENIGENEKQCLKGDARAILTFLQPHITEKQRGRFMMVKIAWYSVSDRPSENGKPSRRGRYELSNMR